MTKPQRNNMVRLNQWKRATSRATKVMNARSCAGLEHFNETLLNVVVPRIDAFNRYYGMLRSDGVI